MNAGSNKAWMVGFAALAAAMLVGCGNAPKAYDLTVTVDPAIQSQTQVHLFGGNETLAATYTAMSAPEYFADPRNYGPDRYVMPFAAGGGEQTLGRKDPTWDKWLKQQGADRVFVYSASGGSTVVSLRPKTWEGGTKNLNVSVQPGKVYVTTAQRPQE